MLGADPGARGETEHVERGRGHAAHTGGHRALRSGTAARARLPGRSVFDVFVARRAAAAGAHRAHHADDRRAGRAAASRQLCRVARPGAPRRQPVRGARRPAAGRGLHAARASSRRTRPCGAPRPRATRCRSTSCCSPTHIAELLEASGARILVALGPHPQLDIWQKALQVREQLPGLTLLRVAPPGHAGRGGRARLPRRARGAARGPAHVRRARAATTTWPRIFTPAARPARRSSWRTRTAASWPPRSAARRWPASRADDVLTASLPLFHVGGTIFCGLSALHGRRGTARHVARRHAQPGDGRGLLAHRRSNTA